MNSQLTRSRGGSHRHRLVICRTEKLVENLPLSVCPGPVAEVGPLPALDVEPPGGRGRLHHLPAGEAQHLCGLRHSARLVQVVVQVDLVTLQHHEPEWQRGWNLFLILVLGKLTRLPCISGPRLAIQHTSGSPPTRPSGSPPWS